MGGPCRAAAPARPARRRAPPGCRCREDLDRVRGGDARRTGASGGKGMRAVAAQDARLPPEGIRRPRPFLRCGGRPRIKGAHRPDMLGITSVPAGPQATWRAAINPAGPPSTGLTFEKRSGRAARRPAEHRGRGVGRSVGAEKWVALAWGIISQTHQSRNSGGRKTPTAA